MWNVFLKVIGHKTVEDYTLNSNISVEEIEEQYLFIIQHHIQYNVGKLCSLHLFSAWDPGTNWRSKPVKDTEQGINLIYMFWL